jgi:hypothetical protein
MSKAQMVKDGKGRVKDIGMLYQGKSILSGRYIEGTVLRSKVK